MAKQVIPYGDRILVKRRPIGEKLGSKGIILAADTTKDRPTDLADVVFIPDHTFCDKKLLENTEEIIANLTEKAKSGSHEALMALIHFNAYLKIKAIEPGMAVMISKYVGTDFTTSDGKNLTLVKGEDIIGLVIDEM